MNIAEIRKKCGIKQEELAKEMGVDRSTVAKWETGKSMPKAKMIRKLAEVLNCTLEDLLKE